MIFEKIQMEFELTVSALESKLWPRVFIESDHNYFRKVT